jgi:alcohol dehydrogenase class IV
MTATDRSVTAPARSSYETWHQWRKVVNGPGCRATLPDELASLGAQRVFLVTTRSLVSQAELLDTVRTGIGDALVGEFAECQPHTPSALLIDAAEEVRRVRPDCLVSFGGSTVVDTAKGLALVVGTGIKKINEFALYVYPPEIPDSQFANTPLSHVAIPTTLSGAEYSDYVGITDLARGRKSTYRNARLAPHTILLDPVVASATPSDLWRSTGMKTMSDAFELTYSSQSHPITANLALAAVGDFYECLKAGTPSATSDNVDLTMRCQLAAWMTHFGVSNSSSKFGIGASIRHQLGARGVPHGMAACMVLPQILAYNLADAAPAHVGKISAALGLRDLHPAASQAVDRIVTTVADFIAQLGLNTSLESFGITPKDFDDLVANIMADSMTPFNPRTVDADAVRAILTSAL